MATAASAIPEGGGPSSTPSSSPAPPPFKSAASTPPGFPVPAATFDADVSGVPTRFVVASFGDCFLVAATQTGALGTVMRVTRIGGGGGGEMESLLRGEEEGGDDDDASFDDADRSRPPP